MPPVKRTRDATGAQAQAANAGSVVREFHNMIFFGAGAAGSDAYISAHGVATTHTFTTPVDLQFYCVHGKILDYHVRNLPNANPEGGMAVIPAGTAGVQDYNLSKYQGRHSPDFFMGHPETYDEDARISLRGLTIVTIRNRYYSPNVRLSTVIAKIMQVYPGIATVHSLHCRDTTPSLGTYPACPGHCFYCGG